MTQARLDLIDLDQELPGQRRFISCWVGRTGGPEVRDGALSFIVDPGPPATADRLIAALEERDVQRLDLVLLTHIHLDHGGATARILERWPGARVVCHPAGRKHLVDPSRLWEGSRQVLGHKAEVYGEPGPVPAAALLAEGAPLPGGLRSIPTPGHAPHHLAFALDGNLFLGEAAGTYSSLGAGLDHTGDEYYLRPATPPRFKLPVAVASLDRLLALDPLPGRLCFAHHGSFAGNGRQLLAEARGQLELWVDTIARVVQAEVGGALPPASRELDALLGRLTHVLQEVDPRFARGERLPADIQERERDFTRQTLRGMLGFLVAEGRLRG